MAHPRIVVPGSTVAFSRRATYRKAFLGDWDQRVGEAWLYALADAQRVHRVAVHHGVRCVSHHHVEVTAGEANLPAFLHRFHRDVSCALNTLLAHERYGASAGSGSPAKMPCTPTGATDRECFRRRPWRLSRGPRRCWPCRGR